MLKKKHPKTTAPYLPEIIAAVERKDIAAANQRLQDAAIDYFTRLNEAAGTIPVNDAAILICLYRHIANELERHDPVAASLAQTLAPVPLPPINYIKKK